VSARDLRNAYLSALKSRGGGRRMIEVAGRRVTLLPALPQRGFVYVHDDVAYSANSFHVDGSELEELIGKLPGRGTPSPPLQRLLPAELAGVDLQRRAFTGRQWLDASPERSFQPEVAVRLQEFVDAAGAPSSGLTAAWAFGPDGPKVVAYRIIGLDGRTLLRSFLRTVEGVHTRGAHISGKQVVVAETGVSGRRGYLYVDRQTLFVAGSNHLNTREVGELFARLP
jgi:hypothetical protein